MELRNFLSLIKECNEKGIDTDFTVVDSSLDSYKFKVFMDNDTKPLSVSVELNTLKNRYQNFIDEIILNFKHVDKLYSKSDRKYNLTLYVDANVRIKLDYSQKEGQQWLCDHCGKII